MKKNADLGRPARNVFTKCTTQRSASASEIKAAAKARLGQPNSSLVGDPQTADFWQRQGPNCVRISVSRVGFWEFDEAGRFANVLPIFDEDDHRIDSVAWFEGRPADWWLYHGDATMLGERAKSLHYLTGWPIRLVANPAEWVGAGGYALCVLDWNVSPVRLLTGIKRIEATPAMRRLVHERTVAEAVVALPPITVVEP